MTLLWKLKKWILKEIEEADTSAKLLKALRYYTKKLEEYKKISREKYRRR